MQQESKWKQLQVKRKASCKSIKEQAVGEANIQQLG
jgi:hypothetical protein